jgi:glycosyltransferase involved in cell wall biosynthesis
MYFIPITVPIFIEGGRQLLHSDWKRALWLLRDSLGGRYGELVVGAPWLSASSAAAREQCLETVTADEGIRLEPVFDGRIRSRQFWLRESPAYARRLGSLLDQADVVHTGLDDLYRPMMELAFVAAVARGLPTVFVQDTDMVQQIRELTPAVSHERIKDAIYTSLYERTCRLSVAHADLALLKGKALMHRYAAHARNAREFHNTSYLASEVLDSEQLERRLAGLAEPRALRLVYCGRLVGRKGLQQSVHLVERARAAGADIEFDMIGDGPMEASLREQIERAGLSGCVRLLGSRPYGIALLRELASYDALLFTPTAEDTPRMIFDGYAAGLPTIGVDIPYVRERAEEEHATWLLPRADADEAVARIVALASHRGELAQLSRTALRAGQYHAAENWYKRRAEWTHEAIAAKTRTKTKTKTKRRKASAEPSLGLAGHI